jgi:hypothetical protein
MAHVSQMLEMWNSAEERCDCGSGDGWVVVSCACRCLDLSWSSAELKGGIGLKILPYLAPVKWT